MGKREGVYAVVCIRMCGVHALCAVCVVFRVSCVCGGGVGGGECV